MQPPVPAVRIEVFPGGAGGFPFAYEGLCDYLSPSPLSPTGLIVQIRVGKYWGTRPIPEQDIETYFKQGLNQPGVTVLSITPISGVGDQAGIVIESYKIHGTIVYGAAFWVLSGTTVFDCNEFYYSSPTATQQSELRRCAQRVVSRV